MTALDAAGAAIGAALGSVPGLEWAAAGPAAWRVVLAGAVRRQIPVAVELGPSGCRMASFLLRGPRDPRRPGAADLHRLLLRKNRATAWVRFCLDGDDDVVLLARIPLAAVDETSVGEALGEMLMVADGAFEGLVHVGYPGVFAPLRPGTAAPAAGS